jgi:GWxTD domain-containing protein
LAVIKIAPLTSLIWLMTFISSSSQTKPDSLDLWLDYACFRISPEVTEESLTAVEIYYGFYPKELMAETKDTLREIDLSLELYSLSDSLLGSQSWRMAYKALPQETTSTGKFLSDVYRTWLAPGEYRIKLAGQDSVSAKSGSHDLFVKVPKFTSSNLELSDIQLALEVKESREQSRFVKNSRLVWPNPTTVYGSLNPLLYFYAEIYNLSPSTNDSLYAVNYTVLDSSGNVFKDYGEYPKVKPGNSAAIASGLNITVLPMGKYQLQLTVNDPSRNQTAQKKKTFFIYREEELAKPAEPALEPATEEEAKSLREVISYITTPEQLKMYDKLTLEGKQNFLKDLWQSKDPDPATPVNEFKNEIYRRFAYASAHFASGRFGGPQNGRKTDRGRVYILYGQPNEINPYPYSPNQKPWEKWTYYNLQGGAVFIFEDQDGYGNYELVHSTARGERRDPVWDKFLVEEHSLMGN